MSPDTKQFTSSDAGKLNPYLRCVLETEDEGFVHTICWTANSAATEVIK